MLLKRDIDWGMNWGWIVYDSQAEPGELTDRLLDLMERCWEEKNKYSIDNFYIGEYGNLSNWLKDDRLKYIDNMKEFEYYYINKIGGTFAQGDNKLVVFLNEAARVTKDITKQNSKKGYKDTYVILGSY